MPRNIQNAVGAHVMPLVEVREDIRTCARGTELDSAPQTGVSAYNNSDLLERRLRTALLSGAFHDAIEAFVTANPKQRGEFHALMDMLHGSIDAFVHHQTVLQAAKGIVERNMSAFDPRMSAEAEAAQQTLDQRISATRRQIALCAKEVSRHTDRWQ